MAYNVYLKNEIRNATGFESGPKPTFKGKEVFGENEGRTYVMWADTPITDSFKEFVVEITCYDFVPVVAKREYGVYKDKSATCELLPSNNRDNDRRYWLKITAKTVEDIREIRYKILAGLIHPEVSYECPTEGPTRQQLIDLEIGLQADLRLVREELAITEAKLASAEQERDAMQKEIEYLNDQLRLADDTMVHDSSKMVDLAMMMGKLAKGWPWVNARRLAKEVFAIINREPPTE